MSETEKAARAVVFLARVSTDKDQSTDVQIAAGRRWAAAEGVEIDVRAEDAVHGDSATRPVLERIMDEARAGTVGTVVAVALDRLGRSAVDLIVRLNELRTLNVRVVSLRENLDFSTPIGRMVASIFAHVAELELESIRARTRAGLNGWELAGVAVPAETPGAMRVAVRSRKRVGRPRGVLPDDQIAAARARHAAGEALDAVARDLRGTIARRSPDGSAVVEPWTPNRRTLGEILARTA